MMRTILFLIAFTLGLFAQEISVGSTSTNGTGSTSSGYSYFGHDYPASGSGIIDSIRYVPGITSPANDSVYVAVAYNTTGTSYVIRQWVGFTITGSLGVETGKALPDFEVQEGDIKVYFCPTGGRIVKASNAEAHRLDWIAGKQAVGVEIDLGAPEFSGNIMQFKLIGTATANGGNEYQPFQKWSKSW